MFRSGKTACVWRAGRGLIAVAAVCALSCTPCVVADDSQAESGAILVPANQAWVDTHVDVVVGSALTVSASGEIIAACEDRFGQGNSQTVGPEGTFLVPNGVAAQKYPLAAGTHGPASCFCLIGRIDDGPAFYVGRRMSFRVPSTGRLFLGINDFDVTLNEGSFRADVSVHDEPVALRRERKLVSSATEGEAVPGARVVVIYVDGLRPDVIREMAAMGHIPTIRRLFLDEGTWMANTFTAFPSDTITSNGTMWTGCFSDRHGLKGQVRFSRSSLTSASYLETLGPGRSSKLLKPSGIDKGIAASQKWVRTKIQGEETASQWYESRVTETPAIYHFLRDGNQDWATGVLPLMTEVPPLMWTRSMAREMPWISAHNAWQYIDDANANFALRHLLHRQSPVTILWFPETDSVSHKECRGQFGSTRRTIAKVDQLVKRIVEDLQVSGEIDRTYFMLVSDHGHHGGREQHLRHYDLANDFFYRAREVNSDGEWVSGGLGLSVRMHRFWNRHAGHHQREFVFIDGDSDGVARIFLPKKESWSRDWSGPNRPGDLMTYRISRNHEAIDLIRTLTEASTESGARVVDLVLARLNASAILVATADRGDAVIDRKLDDDGRWVYRYRPISRIWSDGNGGVYFRVKKNPTVDPLGLCAVVPAKVFPHYYDEQSWLAATAKTDYPDAVVVLTRHMLWQKNIDARRAEYSPDLVVTARRGWYFGTDSSPGTMHGYPTADAMRASWFVSGPNIRKGARIDRPCRLADLTPTILSITSPNVDQNWFDGRAQRQFYEPDSPASDGESQLVFWDDVNLRAWQPLEYEPSGVSPDLPLTINRPASRYDLNNTVYNAAAIADVSLFRVFDDVLSPLTKRPRIARRVENADSRWRRSDRQWIADGARAINLPEASLSDYSFTSLGNLQRVSGAVDWVQGRTEAARWRSTGSAPSKPMRANRAVDLGQEAFWETYRFGQRLLIQTLDETLLNGIENSVDRAVNASRQSPTEVVVD